MNRFPAFLLILALALLSEGAPASEPAVAKSPPVKAAAKAEARLQTFTGKVLPVKKALEKLGIKADADSNGVVLVTAEGALYSIVKDDTTRLLFMDERLHDRTVRLTARQVPGTHFLQAGSVHTVKDGVAHEVFYWCDECQLRANQPGACICCGAETELTEIPVK